MADKIFGTGDGVGRRMRDMLDGSFAEVIVAKDGTSVGADLAVPQGASLSGGMDVRTRRLRSVACPANVDGATDLSFQVSQDAGTYRNMYRADGTEYSIKIGADRHVVIDAELFAGVSFIQIRLGTAAAPVVATAPRSFSFILL